MAHAFTPEAPPPRWVDVDLAALRPGERAPLGLFVGAPPGRGAALAPFGGPALAAALLARDDRTEGPEIVVSVGDAVRRGVPTAVRASITGRAPLTGLLGEGQVGGAVGPALAALADALLVRGVAPRPGLALRVDAEGVELVDPGPPGATTREALAAVARATRAAAALAVGPAARAGVRFAVVVALGDPPHVVGRGGLGALLAATGLVGLGIAVTPASPAEPEADDELRNALLASPRLAARAEGGTFEQAVWEPDGAGLLEGARAARTGRHGCVGCPTPCGWAFDRPGGGRGGARFGAAEALARSLGLEAPDALALLARCDELGLDAKEAGAALAVGADAGAAGLTRGDAAACRRALEAVAAGAASGLELGAAGAARALGGAGAVRTVKGAATRPRAGVLGVAAAAFSSRGADPMRTFAFGPGSGLDGDRLRRLVAPLPLPDDTDGDRALGRLLWWHENLSLALDVTGFCAFSAAGLLSDGVCDLDALARWIAPPAARADAGRAGGPGARLLAVGDALALLQRDLCVGWGQAAGADLPPWADGAVDAIWEEYRVLRGLDADGRLAAGGRARLRRPLAFDPTAGRESRSAPERASSRPDPEAVGRVALAGAGALGRALGEGCEVSLGLPARVGDVLAELARQRPRAADLLVAGGAPLPAVFRDGERLDADALVRDGDRLELVLAIAGG